MSILLPSMKFASLLFELRRIRELVKGQKVMIVGSSPFSDFRRFEKDMTVVNLNGSISRNIAAGIPETHITFLDFEIVDPRVNREKMNRSEIISKGILKDAELGYVILTQSNSSKGGDLSLVANNYKKSIYIGKKLRRLIVLLVTKNLSLDNRKDGKLSTGGFAIAFVAAFKPETIYLTGFSFFKNRESDDPPHFYDDKLVLDERALKDTRSHSLADSLLISSLAVKGVSIESDDRDLKPLISNWGTK